MVGILYSVLGKAITDMKPAISLFHSEHAQ